MRRNVISLMLLLNVALAVALASLWFDHEGRIRNVHWVAPAAIVPELAVLPALQPLYTDDVSKLMLATERPLFSPSRRPPPPPPPPPPPVVPPPPDPLQTAELRGVFGSAGGGANGGVLARIDGRMRKIFKGDAVGEWSLKAVDASSATFERNGETRVINLTISRLATSTSVLPPIGQPRVVPVNPQTQNPSGAPGNPVAGSPSSSNGPRATFGGTAARPRPAPVAPGGQQ
jgi:hypothetical protein